MDFFVKNSAKMNKILFIANIFTYVFSFVSFNIYCSINNINSYLSFAFLWIYLFFLPIPIFNFIISIIYKKNNLKYKRLLYSSIITFFIIFIVGYLPINKNMHLKYSEGLKYKTICDIEFPSEGNYYHIEYIDNENNPYTDFIVFNDSDSKEFWSNINLSDKWILKDNILDDILKYFPWSLDGSESRKYLVYNKSVNDYNVIDMEIKNEFYIMTFDTSSNTLIIENVVI